MLGAGSLCQQPPFPPLQVSHGHGTAKHRSGVVLVTSLVPAKNLSHRVTVTAPSSSAFWLRAGVAAGQLRGAVAGFHGLDVRGGRLHKARPEPVLAPHDYHLLDGDVLGLRQQERHEQRHHQHPPREEQEDAVLRKHPQLLSEESKEDRDLW